MNDEIKQKSRETGKGLFEVFGFIIGAIGLYIYLGLIGVALLWGLDAILHAFLGH